MASAYPWQADAHSQLLEMMSEFAQFGATDKNGVARLAGSANDGLVRDHLSQWLKAHDFTVSVDSIGNIFGILDLNGGDASRYFFCGSHLDTQPHGGRFDGALGVACACVAGLHIKHGLKERGMDSSSRFYVVACWTGEEGARFQPSLIGSRAFVGNADREESLSVQDRDGVSLKQALSLIGYLGDAEIPTPAHYLELHIEQGKYLEKNSLSMAVVSACWGANKLRIQLTGRSDHTGPTPMVERRDALLAAAKLIVFVKKLTQDQTEPLHSSVARIEVEPNSPNTVAESVQLWVEIRSPNQRVLEQADNAIQAYCKQIKTETGCGLDLLSRELRDVVEFDTRSVEIAEQSLSGAGISFGKMQSIAGHDAVQLQSLCPSTLLFVPSKNGISHSPEEFTSDDDVVTGFDGMMTIMIDLLASSSPALAARSSVS